MTLAGYTEGAAPMPALEASRPWLNDLQGGIIRAHGRDHSHHLFLSFTRNQATPFQVRAWLKEFVTSSVSSAWDHLSDARLLERSFRSVLLNYRGYEFINEPAPESDAFRDDLRGRAAKLNDPPLSEWEPAYQAEDIHALVLIANDDRVALARDTVSFRQEAAAVGVSVVLDEPASQLFREGKPIEHFGYADGISQPLIDGDVASTRHYRYWNPSASRELILANEPGAPGHFGTYLVFRKLEQDVALWQRLVDSVAQRTNLDRDLVGARAVGRFKDGRPVLFHSQQHPTGTSVNDFTYHDDAQGLRCPLNAHIRKANPRWPQPADMSGPAPDRRILRRGITYGVRPDLHPHGGGLPPPSKSVGLLFQCYQASIEEQFEHIQSQWMNALNHPEPDAGIDPITGRASPGTLIERGLDHPRESVDFGEAVRFRGGGYFFSPSLTFLRNL
jgi:Dyp-type peroxidase family